jgi:hypothetical protein
VRSVVSKAADRCGRVGLRIFGLTGWGDWEQVGPLKPLGKKVQIEKIK